jgi:Domain of unknown function (DUF5680)
MAPVIALDELAGFLVEAHRQTYANKKAVLAPSTRLNSVDYHFECGEFAYHDTYFGVRDFIGEEIIYRAERPIWGMNYFGVLLGAALDEKKVYGFLRDALMQDCVGIVPARGPTSHADGDWRYSNSVNGELDGFVGLEEIFRAGEPVYRAQYHGGCIG